MRHFPFLSFVVLVAGLIASVSAQDYAIKMTRPAKAGVKYHLNASGSLLEQKAIITGGKTNLTSSEHRIELSGKAEVLEIDAKGHELKTAITIEKCVKTTGKSQLDLLPDGKTIIATSTNGQAIFAITDGATLLPGDAALLQLVVPLYDGSADPDELFGTAERQHLGSSWPINAAAVVRDMQQRGMDLKSEDIHGTTTFVSMTNVAGRDCFELRTEMQIKSMAPPLPLGTRLARSEVKTVFNFMLPVDATRERASDSAHFTIKLAYQGKTGPKKQEVMVEGVQERKSERRMTYLAE